MAIKTPIELLVKTDRSQVDHEGARPDLFDQRARILGQVLNLGLLDLSDRESGNRQPVDRALTSSNW